MGRFDFLIRRFSSLLDQQRFLVDKLKRYAEAFRIALGNADDDEDYLRAWSIAERSKSFYLCQLLASAGTALFEGAAADEFGVAGASLEYDYVTCDFIVTVETLRQRAGLSLWSYEDIKRYSFLNIK